MNTLKLRLRHCLQTIIDVQPAMRRIYRRSLASDFSMLSEYLGKIDQLHVCEADVQRMEQLACKVLREIRMSGHAQKSGSAH